MLTNSRRVHMLAEYALLLTVALLLSWLESILPLQFPVPGVKLGLSNLTVVFLLYRKPFWQVFLFGLGKCLLSLTFTGRLSGLIFSLAGYFCAIFVMALLRNSRFFSPLGVNVAGAAFHGVGQLAAAAVLFTPEVFGFLPLMTLCSAGCGIVTWGVLRVLLLHPGLK